MNKELTKTPVFIYIVLSGVSVISALIFFHLGGSLAEMTGKTEYGFSFKAGGALAGFLIVMWVSIKQYFEKMIGDHLGAMDDVLNKFMGEWYMKNMVPVKLKVSMENLIERIKYMKGR
ncbi:MAG: hypothetical protein ABFS32_21130 [Bacteroidota bacterium]